MLSAIGVLAAIVAVHEAGHFFAARSQGIHVSKFAIGFGPPLIKYQGPEVEYSLRAVPLGGFVAFPDEDADCPYPPDDPDLLKNRPILDRAIVITAGVIANAIFAFSLLFTQVSVVCMCGWGGQSHHLHAFVVVVNVMVMHTACTTPTHTYTHLHAPTHRPLLWVWHRVYFMRVCVFQKLYRVQLHSRQDLNQAT